jgi:hypothetical protein
MNASVTHVMYVGLTRAAAFAAGAATGRSAGISIEDISSSRYEVGDAFDGCIRAGNLSP